ncbi:MAG: hypothetical protein WC260_04415, partial [Candidatus Pacearchaeota archaeon]
STSGTVVGNSYTSGVIGYAIGNTNVTNVFNTASISGGNYTAGLVGYFNPTNTNYFIKYSYNSGIINGRQYVGGITGRVHTGRVEYVYNVGLVQSTSNSTGGITGHATSSIVNYSYNTGAVYSASSTYLGSIIGYISSNTNNYLYNDVSIVRQANIIPGFSLATSPIGSTSSANVLDLEHGEMIGSYSLANGLSRLDTNTWSYKDSNGFDGYYPELRVFSEGSTIQRVKSEESVTTYLFSGHGTMDSPYDIRTYQDMEYLSLYVDSGYETLNKYYHVPVTSLPGSTYIPNITLGSTYNPIGTIANPFKGHFNGNSTNFTVSLDKNDYVGLFGYITNGSISNLSVSGSVSGFGYVGGVAGYSASEVSDVYVISEINGANYVGGIVGYNAPLGKINYAYNANIVNGNSSVGGITGSNEGTISEVYNRGVVLGYTNIGGIIGVQTTGSISSGYYDITVIEDFSEVGDKLKPTSAISGVVDASTVKGNLTEHITGQNAILNEYLMFNDSKWFLSNSNIRNNELVTYYPQLVAFSSHPNSIFRNNSINSVVIPAYDASSGSGASNDPLIIKDSADMNRLSDIVNGGTNLANYFIKVADGVTEIDLRDINFKPIGFGGRTFNGTFDGNGANFILGLDYASDSYVALFGYVSGATISNLSTSGTVVGNSYTSGVIGYAIGNTNITNVRNSATISGATYTAGVVGRYNPTNTNYFIRNSYNSGNVTGGSNVGGITGRTDTASLENVYNVGSIVGTTYVGGLIGYHYSGNLMTSYSASTIYGTTNVGAVVGYFRTGTNRYVYYDNFVIEDSPIVPGLNKPTDIYGSGSAGTDVRALEHSEMIGSYALNQIMTQFDKNIWIVKDSNGF